MHCKSLEQRIQFLVLKFKFNRLYSVNLPEFQDQSMRLNIFKKEIIRYLHLPN